MTTGARHLHPLPGLACDEVADLLPAYSLDALDRDERQSVDAHLTRCAACRSELDRLERVVGQLGTAVAPAAPPAALRARLLDEIVRPAPPPVARPADPAPAPPAPIPFRTRRVVLSRFAAAGLALVASILLIGLVGAGVLLHQAQKARDHAQQGQQEVAEYLRHGGVVTALVPAPGATHLLGEGSGSLIVAPNQPMALLVVYGLPSGSGQTYQVWAERGGERTDVASLKVDDEGAGWLIVSTPHPLISYDVVGIAMTHAGQPATDMLTVQVPHGATR